MTLSNQNGVNHVFRTPQKKQGAKNTYFNNSLHKQTPIYDH